MGELARAFKTGENHGDCDALSRVFGPTPSVPFPLCWQGVVRIQDLQGELWSLVIRGRCGENRPCLGDDYKWGVGQSIKLFLRRQQGGLICESAESWLVGGLNTVTINELVLWMG